MKLILQLIFSSFLFVAVSSCDKKLDLFPTDSIDETKAFQTADDLQRGVMGVYALNSQINKSYIGSLLADEARLSSENRGQGQFVHKWQYTSTDINVTSAYRQYYAMIDRIHRVLKAVPRITPASPAETVLINKLTGELSALKAVAYFEILINVMPPGYNPDAPGIALVDESCLTCKPPRNKVGEVITAIQSLLASARSNADIPAASSDPIRISKAAIAAYQARVALLTKNWAAAISFSTDAMNLSGKTLATGANFVSYWSDANEIETLWKYRNQTTPTLLWRDANGDVFFEPSMKLKNLFNRANDARFPTYFGSIGTDSSVIRKFKGSSLGATINDNIILRYSELLLLRAEAYAESGNLTLAAADINTLRSARITGYVNVSFASAADAINSILEEKTKELCFEGFRYYDLKRRSLPVNRLAVDVESSAWQNLSPDNFLFTLPIPQDAIDANPNTKQNAGY